VLLVKDAGGETRSLILVGSDGRKLNSEILDFVAEPITVTGELLQSGETLILRAEPRSFVRTRR
jgi:hypothetical protein